jgi:hypothetical protein
LSSEDRVEGILRRLIRPIKERLFSVRLFHDREPRDGPGKLQEMRVARDPLEVLASLFVTFQHINDLRITHGVEYADPDALLVPWTWTLLDPDVSGPLDIEIAPSAWALGRANARGLLTATSHGDLCSLSKGADKARLPGRFWTFCAHRDSGTSLGSRNADV